VGPRAGLDTVVKRKTPSRRRESNPDHPIIQPVAWSLYRLIIIVVVIIIIIITATGTLI
jgi:hypothetical protein